ncbi:MAG: hypothetical protein V4812_00440 [Pseudomonadota bacterium]
MPEPHALHSPVHPVGVAPTDPLRIDPWSESTRGTVHYRIVAGAEPDILCRLLNGFAQQSLLPCRVEMLRRDPLLEIEISQSGLSWHRAELIAQKMRAQVDVCSVQLQACHEPLTPLPSSTAPYA